MKAKEILSLCEDKQKLTSDEIFDLINGYFTKKIKNCGLDFTVMSLSLCVGAYTKFENLKKSSLVIDSDIFTYLKELSKVIKFCVQKESNLLYVRFVDQKRVWRPDDSIFYIRCFYPSVYRGFVNLEVILGYKFQQYIENLDLYPEFATEETLKAVYARIDAIAKAFRLVPFVE